MKFDSYTRNKRLKKVSETIFYPASYWMNQDLQMKISQDVLLAKMENTETDTDILFK